EDVPEAEQQVLFEKMGNSLGALGFLIDMLSYQRNMARKLYEFDENEGELKLLMGRVRVRSRDEGQKSVSEVVQARVEQIVQPVVLSQGESAQAEKTAENIAQPTMLAQSKAGESEGA